MDIFKILTGPVKGLVESIGGVIDKLTTTTEEKMAAQLALAKLEQEFQLKLAEVDAKFAETQRDVIVAEAAGQSWLQRNWRPILMLFFAVIIGTITWTGGYINGRQLDNSFVLKILDIIEVGLGGYVVGRTAEKIVPKVAEIFVSNKK